MESTKMLGFVAGLVVSNSVRPMTTSRGVKHENPFDLNSLVSKPHFDCNLNKPDFRL